MSDHLNEVVFGGHKMTMREKRDLQMETRSNRKGKRKIEGNGPQSREQLRAAIDWGAIVRGAEVDGVA